MESAIEDGLEYKLKMKIINLIILFFYIIYIYYMNYILFIVFVIFIFYIVNYFTLIKRQELTSHDIINTILRGSARWAAASLQDKSPIVAVLHANYAAGYLWALKDSFSDIDIQRATGIDIIKFQKKIIDVQDKSTQMLLKECPQYASNIDIYLGKIAKEYT